MAGPTLTDLARRGEIAALEDRWLEAIETPDGQRDDLLAALETLRKDGRGARAADLAWTWLSTEAERREPRDVLVLGRELILRCEDNDQMRREIVRLYHEVFADRPEIARLIDASGLAGEKSARRALRTLEICLDLKVGDVLISRSDEHAAQVTAVAPDACEYTIQTPSGAKTLDADGLALAYDAADRNDFRVLAQLDPGRLKELLDTDPVSFVIGILKSHRGRLDSDQLEHLVTPRFVDPDAWRKWWSKAKTALKRCPNVVMEGRNPLILTYHERGQTLEDEILPQWERAETPTQRLSVIDTYFREVKARGLEPDPEAIKRLRRDLLNRVKTSRRGSPGEALAEALVIDRLAESVPLPEEDRPARAIMGDSRDPVRLLNALTDVPLYLRALDHLKAIRPADWADVFAGILPTAPPDGCQAIAAALAAAGRADLLTRAVERVPEDFTNHLDALCWLWKGPSLNGVEPPLSPRELLLRLLEHLAELHRSETAAHETLRDARIKIRAALSASDYKQYRRVIQEMDSGLASTVRRTIDRLDGLGQVVRSDLLRIILETHPELLVKAVKVDPWFDDAVIFCTQEGLARREEQLNHLVNVKMRENAKAIGDAAAHGDLSENSEYKFALEERDLLRARVARIQDELSRARVMRATDVETDAVHIGTHVGLVPAEGGPRHDMTILGPFEADVDRGIYNYRAPLCGELKGLRIGDTATLDLGDGPRAYRVESISNALEQRVATH